MSRRPANEWLRSTGNKLGFPPSAGVDPTIAISISAKTNC